MFTHSVEQSKEQSAFTSVQALQEELAKAKANHQQQANELAKVKASHQIEMERVIADCHAQVKTHESAAEQLRKEICELRQKQKAPKATPRRKLEQQKVPKTASQQVITKLDTCLQVP